MVELDLSSQKTFHPLLGIYQDTLQILEDIIEPILDEKEWESTENEFAQVVNSEQIFKLLE